MNDTHPIGPQLNSMSSKLMTIKSATSLVPGFENEKIVHPVVLEGLLLWSAPSRKRGERDPTAAVRPATPAPLNMSVNCLDK